MCGTIGFVDKRGRLSESEKVELIKKMIASIEHRGRDDTGHFVEGSLAMGNVRLGILDVSDRGHQPFSDDSGEAIVSYNGEIYNYLDVNRALSKGHSFTSSCDTETLVYAYLDDPEGFLSRLHGMWALSLFDKKHKKLLLAVDRFAIKPLYYVDTNDWFAWSSEAKSLFLLPGFEAALEPGAISEQILFRHVAGDRTLFKDIHRVLPAQIILYDFASATTRGSTYWHLEAHEVSGKKDTAELSRLLTQSVHEHLLADVPVGLQLSGGVDSSLVAAIASKSKQGLHTYSIGLKDDAWNEFPYSRRVAEEYGTVHHELLFTEKDFYTLLPHLTYMLDEPLGHSHAIPMHILATHARKDVKVLLSGEGADEAFLGYTRHPAAVADAKDDMKLLFSNAFSNKKTASKVVQKFDEKKALAFRLANVRASKKEDAARRVTSYDLATYLIPLLIRQDKMGMAANLENRVPFLDHRVVEFAYSLPRERKVGAEGKIILKEVAEEYFPHDFVYRRKVGFGQPIAEWLRNPRGLGGYLKLFEKGVAPKHIDYAAAQSLAEEHRSKRADNGSILWTLLTLEIWMRVFLKKQKPTDLLKSLT